MEKTCGVYQITNRTDGKRYIGSTVDFAHRHAQHLRHLRAGKHHSIVLQRAWNKYGSDSFAFEPILICSEERLAEYEQRFLNAIKPEYNISVDAVAPMRGRTMSAESRAKMSASGRGRVVSDDTRRLISKSKIGNTVWRGRKHSMSAIEKCRIAKIGKPLSDEHKEKLSAAKFGKTRGPLSEVTRSKISAAKKRYWDHIKTVRVVKQ